MEDNNNQEENNDVFDSVPGGEGKLLIKLKIPRDDQERQENRVNKNRDIGDNKKMTNKILVCDLCGKVFPSGKALGGHKSFHVQQAKNKDRILKNKQILSREQDQIEEEKDSFLEKITDSSDIPDIEKSTCVVCGQIFPSMKSLSGHMRFHPERNWRGLQPPRKSFAKKSFSPSSSSSSALLDEEEFGMVNLEESLSGWSVKARRGRKAVIYSSEVVSDSELDAVNDLMMLANSDPNIFSKEELVVDNIDNPDSYSEKLDQLELEVEGKGSNEIVKTRIVDADADVDVDAESINISKEVNEQDHDQGSSNSSKGEELKVVNKKPIKKKRLSDLDMVQDDNEKIVPSGKYCCGTCGRSFPSPQALGGHRSSHKKMRISIQNSIDNVGKNQLPSSSGEGEASHSCRRELDFDLNEMPTTKDEAANGLLE